MNLNYWKLIGISACSIFFVQCASGPSTIGKPDAFYPGLKAAATETLPKKLSGTWVDASGYWFMSNLESLNLRPDGTGTYSSVFFNFDDNNSHTSNLEIWWEKRVAKIAVGMGNKGVGAPWKEFTMAKGALLDDTTQRAWFPSESAEGRSKVTTEITRGQIDGQASQEAEMMILTMGLGAVAGAAIGEGIASNPQMATALLNGMSRAASPGAGVSAATGNHDIDFHMPHGWVRLNNVSPAEIQALRNAGNMYTIQPGGNAFTGAESVRIVR